MGENLYFSTVESALQECIDNYGGLQNVETSIFIKSGTYRPKYPLRFSVFGETSSINFIGEGIDKTILECHTLNKLIAFQANSEYQHHVWTFKDMTMKGCEKKSEMVNVNIFFKQEFLKIFLKINYGKKNYICYCIGIFRNNKFHKC